MKLLFTLILAISFGGTINAQGLNGKRFTFSYQPGYSFTLGYYQDIDFMLHHRANLGFALSDHWTVNASFLYSHRETRHSSYEDFIINDMGGGISFLYFRKIHQSFAPNGRYMGFGFDYGTSNGKHLNPNITDDSKEYSYSELGKTNLMVASAIFGRNFIIKDHILIGYGIQWGFTIGAYQPQRHLGKPFFNLGLIF